MAIERREHKKGIITRSYKKYWTRSQRRELAGKAINIRQMHTGLLLSAYITLHNQHIMPFRRAILAMNSVGSDVLYTCNCTLQQTSADAKPQMSLSARKKQNFDMPHYKQPQYAQNLICSCTRDTLSISKLHMPCMWCIYVRVSLL